MTIADSNDDEPEFRRIHQVAELFQISRSTAFRLMKEQAWPRHKFGTELRFSKEDVEAIRAMNHEVPARPKVTPNVGTRANRRSKPTTP
ncbi:helix-turn-helix domain-containing protein [Arthrobacter sp. ISL-85]|uniref:helix-turn-helix domain-containing protein n=1 Tax=Arthrobacter sp. ISL-85 TaxID=2819115 RepID=UPI001BE8F4B3|nr:helix-turn-helix domain-containing protein [Arthrobacter sp. ISL-85]MBT2568091.1 helix-turn-helix domain-containing protein [Arthrobacter sp. ISL-85]